MLFALSLPIWGRETKPGTADTPLADASTSNEKKYK
jgi:hypothetical protein